MEKTKALFRSRGREETVPDQWQIYLSETMRNQYIEFRPTPDGETFIACYRNFKIAEFDTENGQLLHRSIARL